MSKKKEFEGKNVEGAIKKGLHELSLDKENADIKILDEGKAGLFGLMGSHPAKVQIKKKRTSSRNLENINWEKALDRVEELTGIIARNIDKNSEIKTEKKGDYIKADVLSEEGGLMIGKNGSTIKDFQYIVNLMLKRDPSTRIDVKIDVENYRAKREEDIKEEISKAVRKVNNEGKPVELEPMESSQRKLVHRNVSSMEGITTESIGKGTSRRVVIKKTNN